MGLLQKLLSTLGLRESSAGRGSERAGETTVTVEHEPNTASESAVKGTDGSTASVSTTGTADADAAEEDAGASDVDSSTASSEDAAGTADIQEAEPETVESDASESADSAEGADFGTTETGEGDAAADEGPESEAEGEAAGTAGSDESTDVLNGIGPAYAERLENAGVETVADLADADAADLADETGLGEGRISNWIEQAKEY